MKEQENKLYDDKADIDKNKSLLILDEIIYPKSFRNIMNEIDLEKKEFEFNLFLKDSYVWVITIHDTNKERLNKATDSFLNYFWEKVKSIGTLFCNGQDFIEEVKNIKEKLNNGIKESIFHEWFMTLAIHLSQMKHPTNSNGSIKRAYLPSSEVLEITQEVEETKSTLFSNYIFVSSEGKLLSKPYISELVKKVDKRIQEEWKNKFRLKKMKNKRTPLDSKLRHECFKRDKYKCVECGSTNKEKILHADHIISVSQGGTDELDNLQTLCDNCNLAKSDKTWTGNLLKEKKDGEDFN